MPKDDFIPDRRHVLAGAASFAAVTPAMAAEPVVTLLGDSITSGYGLPSSQALPVQLQAELRRLGVAAKVHAAGRSGDTTAGGLARLDRAVPADTRLCVVALGGNDLLQFLPPDVPKRNLDAIIRKLKQRQVDVLLAGIGAPPQLGSYALAFNAVFPTLARQYGVPLYPDLLSGVMLNKALNQPDGVHPNAKGVEVIAKRLAPMIRDRLRAQSASTARQG